MVIARSVWRSGLVLGAVVVAALACGRADGPASSTGEGCGRGLGTCDAVEGRDVVVALVPADLAPSPERVETRGEERRVERTFRSAERPWLGPGGPIGRELTVIVARHEPQPRSVQLDPRVLPGSKIEAVANGQVLVSERQLPARRPDGTPTPVPASELVAAVNDRTTVLVIGRGLTVAELRDLAPGIEVH